jgi:protein-S-isoprenylcysteine O-methyltransferase Ste14
VRNGVFARVRHPIYLAMTLFLLALAVGLGHEANLVAAAPCFALGTWVRVREEERLLRARFGADYDSYAAAVKRFVPGLF